MSYAGPWLILEHVYTVALVLALLFLSAGVGRFLLARLRVPAGDPLAGLLYAVAVGGGALATALLAAGLTVGVSTAVLGLLLLAAAAVSRKELAEAAHLCAEAVRSLRLRTPWALAFLAAVTVVLVLLALAPPSDWDSLMYHLEVPARFLEHGRIYLPEDNLHASRVGLVHLLYLPLLAFGSAAAPAVLSAAFASLLALATYSVGARHLGARTGAWASALLWGSAVLVPVAVTARVDVTLAFYLLAAHGALLDAWLGGSRRSFYLAAALLGFAVGVKSSALAYGLAVSPLVLRVAFALAPSVRDAIRPLASFAGFAVAAALPWPLKNAILLGDPLFPLFAPPRVEPWLASLYGRADLPASSEALYRPIRQAVGEGSLLDVFFRPGAVAIEGEAAAYALSPLLLLVPLWILFRRNSALGGLLLPPLIFALVAVLYLPVPNPRYLIPAVAPLTVAVGHIVVTTAYARVPARIARVALALLTALLLVPTAQVVWTRVEATHLGAYLAGRVSPWEYLRRHRAIEVRSHAATVEALSAHTPEDARILMLLEARGLYLEREVIQDNRIMNWPLLAPKALDGDCLAETRITHVLVSRGALAYYETRGLDPSTLRWPDFVRFAERCLTPLYNRFGFSLYEVSGRPR